MPFDSSQPLRVLYVWDDEYPWDVRTEKICAALTSAGHDVHLAARNRRWAPRTEQLAEGTVHRMRPWKAIGKRADAALAFPAFFNPRWVAHLSSTVRSVRPDVIIARDLPLCPTALYAGGRAGVPVLLDMAENYAAMHRSNWEAGRHSLTDYAVRNPALIEAVERYCVRRAAGVLVVIEESGARLERDLSVPSDRIAVVSNTPPRARAQATGTREARARAANGEPLEVAYLGLFEIPRGIGEMIDAVALLRDKHHGRAPVRLSLVGDGRDGALFREQVARLRLTDREVVFHGYLPHDRALEVVSRADVGVVPHHAVDAWNTTIPNKLFDYMAAGLAVITSDAAPAARIVRATGAGEVFRAGDAADLAAAMERLAADEGARCTHAGAAGRRAVVERYNWERDCEVLLRTVSAAARAAAPVLA